MVNKGGKSLFKLYKSIIFQLEIRKKFAKNKTHQILLQSPYDIKLSQKQIIFQTDEYLNLKHQSSEILCSFKSSEVAPVVNGSPFTENVSLNMPYYVTPSCISALILLQQPQLVTRYLICMQKNISWWMLVLHPRFKRPV